MTTCITHQYILALSYDIIIIAYDSRIFKLACNLHDVGTLPNSKVLYNDKWEVYRSQIWNILTELWDNVQIVIAINTIVV